MQRPGLPKAFTMIELVVVISLMLLLAGVMAPLVFKSKHEAQAAKILAMADAIAKASERFYYDNGRFPEDTSVAGDMDKHELSAYDTTSGRLPNWKGPYLLTPLGSSDNPAGGMIDIVNDLGDGAINPKFQGATGAALTEEGCAMVLHSVLPEVAELVDIAIDGSDEPSWKTKGRVTFYEGSGLGTAGKTTMPTGKTFGGPTGSGSSGTGGSGTGGSSGGSDTGGSSGLSTGSGGASVGSGLSNPSSATFFSNKSKLCILLHAKGN